VVRGSGSITTIAPTIPKRKPTPTISTMAVAIAISTSTTSREQPQHQCQQAHEKNKGKEQAGSPVRSTHVTKVIRGSAQNKNDQQ
jgi:hypothetical protein